MTFEGLLPFIMLLVIWGASRILLRMSKANQKKQAPTDRKPVLVKILQQLAAFKEKGMDEEFVEYSHPPHQPMADEQERESLIETAKESLPQKPVMTARKTVSVSSQVGVTKPRTAILQKKPMARMTQSKLKNAVIWAEILAPPVTLRD